MTSRFARFIVYCQFISILGDMAGKEEKNFLKDDHALRGSKCQSAVELSECLKSSVRNVLNQVSDEQFVSIYKTCYKGFDKKDEITRPALSGSSTEGRKYHSQFNDMIVRSAFSTIDETVLNMDNKLKELEELKLSQLNSNISWRPPGNASQHMIPFEFVSETEKKKQLESKIEREQEVLNVLKIRLNQKRNKAKELHESLLASMEEIKNLVTCKINDEQIKTPD